MKSKIIFPGLVLIAAVGLSAVWFKLPANHADEVPAFSDEFPLFTAEEEEALNRYTPPAKATYYGYVWLRVAESRPKIMYDSDQERNYLNDRNTQAILVRSDIVLGVALQQPGIAQLNCLKNQKDKTVWLRRNLDVKFLGESEILQIAISGNSPDELRKILLAVRSAYMDQVVAVDRDMDVRRRMTLESAYKNMDKQIARKKIQLKNLSEQLGVPGSATVRYMGFKQESVESLGNQATQLRAQITGLDRKIMILTGRLGLLPEPEVMSEERRTEAVKEMTIELLKQDPDIAALDREIRELNFYLQEMRMDIKITDENPDETLNANPDFQKLQRRHEYYKQQLVDRAKVLTPAIMKRVEQSLRERPPTPADKLRAEIEILETDRAVFQQQYETIAKALSAELAKAEQIAQGSNDLDNLRSELERMMKMYNQMGTKLEEWTVEAQASARVSPINEPEVSKVPMTAAEFWGEK